MSKTLYDFQLNRLNGTSESLAAYRGKVVLVVNTASECGYTPQYKGLEALYKELSANGFVILGFPSNDFGRQEPGSSAEIATFCERNYGVTFPMFEKIVSKGADATPLYQWLKDAAGEPRWNFHKYLVDKQGHVVKAFPSSVAPDSAELRTAISAALNAAP